MTWARRNAPESQPAITDAYATIGRELGATVAPVGLAWRSFLRDHDTPVLHDRDGSHPTPAGTCLAALFGENPIGIASEVPGVEGEELATLQAAAREAWPSVE